MARTEPGRAGLFYVRDLVEWWMEQLREGDVHAPKAFLGLFTGANAGKMLVRLGPDRTS